MNFQKSVALFMCFLVVHVALAQDPEGIFIDTIERCTATSQIDVALVEQTFSGGGIPDDPVLRAYLHCIFVGLGLQDPNGTIHYDLIRLEPHDLFSFVKHIDDPHAKLTKCEEMNIQGSTPDETLYLAFKCFME